MNRTVTLILMAVASLLWTGWAVLLYVGQTLGDCRDDACFAVRDVEIAVIWWRWLAIELGAVLAYVLLSRRRES